jgi:hypothetical protein
MEFLEEPAVTTTVPCLTKRVCNFEKSPSPIKLLSLHHPRKSFEINPAVPHETSLFQ